MFVDSSLQLDDISVPCTVAPGLGCNIMDTLDSSIIFQAPPHAAYFL